MVSGIESFQKWFCGFEDQYTIIGGTACDLLMSDEGMTQIDGITVLDAGHLILFKAKAWLDLTARKSMGKPVDVKNIRKHKNDIFRLTSLLGQKTRIPITGQIESDMRNFIKAMEKEVVNTKQLGLSRSKDSILEILINTYKIN